ncbi:MAG TPA: response regulator [Gemmatimonadales bacterium]|nr:response regulator [Gemmatimonadales bacterium]
MRQRPVRQPVVLVASPSAPARELQDIAERRGYLVRRAYTTTDALDQVVAALPDLVIFDESLPGIDPLDASRTLRDNPRVGGGVPILLVTAGRPTTAEHHAALRAGVWEYLTHPFHSEEVATKLERYVALKLNADRARHGEARADGTGFFTVQGLALRAQELSLQAYHHAAPLACVALAPVTHDGANASAVDLVARVLLAAGRRSDAIGRVGPGEFAVVAPGTDGAGAVLLAERVAREVRDAAANHRAPALRAGYDAVANARYAPIEPNNLLGRATSALRAAKTTGGARWIRAFQ